MNMKDDWVAAALSNDTLVAELLSRLTQSSSHPPHPFLLLPCAWGHRQRRSKPRKEYAAMTGTRRSPTTPLSWSGASDGDYSNSNSSRPPSDLSRSNKGAYGDDVTNTISSSSSKKKRSFAELKEEESLLLQERVGLKRDLASMNLSLNQQRVRSQSLNTVKFDLICTASSCRAGPFALPDLNMMPSDEEERVSAMT